jgi:hypothetical protein
MSSKGSTEACRHTITLISTSGGVYQLICEEKGAHDEHSGRLFRTQVEAHRSPDQQLHRVAITPVGLG